MAYLGAAVPSFVCNTLDAAPAPQKVDSPRPVTPPSGLSWPIRIESAMTFLSNPK